MNKVILHCDMDNFYASVESIDRPGLKSCPIAVCGDPDLRHGIVLAKNYPARNFGIITGETIFQAKSKCPELLIIKPDYPKYLKYAKLARNIYSKYSNKVYPYGLDEAWVDISNTCTNFEEGKKIADNLRNEIQSCLKLTVSVGVSFNYVFSKLGSDMNKPNSTTIISDNNFRDIVRNIPAFELLFVGPATRKVLKKLRIITIGDLAEANKDLLKIHLGEKGVQLHEFANGNDFSFDPSLFASDELKSISNTITPPRNLTNDNDVAAFIYLLSEAISKRLDMHDFKCRKLSITLRFYDFSSINRSITFSIPECKTNVLFNLAYNLYLKSNSLKIEIRSIGLRAEGLIKNDRIQMSIFDIIEDDDYNNNLYNDIVEDIKSKFGNIKLEFNPYEDMERVI